MWLFTDFAEVCGAMSPLGKLVLAGDLGIAASYFAIPVGMAVLMRDRIKDLPFPWLIGLFAAFITACGLTHLVHAIQMPFTTLEHTPLEAALKSACAVLSIVTAAILVCLMPRIKKLPSPAERRASLEREVAFRTSQKDALVWEINHQLGNQLQIMASALRVERRKATEAEHAALARVELVVAELTRRYREAEPRYAELQGLADGRELMTPAQ
ncbi:MAG: hypothetical protein JWN93_1674 [Hyphomicrobiales bacterium]|nr:hypothetical protein [Hyphomicrobiales bacterium]